MVSFSVFIDTEQNEKNKSTVYTRTLIALQQLACLLSSIYGYFEKRSEYYVHH